MALVQGSGLRAQCPPATSSRTCGLLRVLVFHLDPQFPSPSSCSSQMPGSWPDGTSGWALGKASGSPALSGKNWLVAAQHSPACALLSEACHAASDNGAGHGAVFPQPYSLMWGRGLIIFISKYVLCGMLRKRSGREFGFQRRFPDAAFVNTSGH